MKASLPNREGRPSKLLDGLMLDQVRAEARSESRTVVWTNGCFDLLHVGHIRCLRAAAEFGDVLIVGINRDRSVRRLKGESRPIVPELERAEVIGALACVDYVTLFGDETPVRILARLKPDVCCKSTEYEPPEGRPLPEADLVRAYGGRFEFIPHVPSRSTSALVQLLQRLESKRGSAGVPG